MMAAARLLGFLVGLCAALAAWAPAARAAAQAPTVFVIGYLELLDDARYAPRRGYAGLGLKTPPRPFEGARLAIRESRILKRVLKIDFRLERRTVATTEDLVAEIERLYRDHDSRFFILDLPGEAVATVAAATGGRDLMLFNVSAGDDALRAEACAAHLMHTIPSRAMLADALAQFLVAKGWREVLMLVGPLAEDHARAAAFQRAARKLGVKIVAVKDFLPGNDPRERDRNNIELMTARPAHDVVYLADSNGEFGRYVPYGTRLPRPVVGTQGLRAAAWHWSWERYGAPQLNQRFTKLAKRSMTDGDWAAWAAVKAIVETVQRTKARDFATIAGYLKSDRLTLDAYKGTPAGFRAWDNQLRQPILLHSYNAVLARAPMAGFLHARNNLDTLGTDQPESRCRIQG